MNFKGKEAELKLLKCFISKARICAIVLEENGFDNITLTPGQRSYINHLEFEVFHMPNEETIPFIVSVMKSRLRI